MKCASEQYDNLSPDSVRSCCLTITDYMYNSDKHVLSIQTPLQGTEYPRPTQPSIPPGLVSEYQLRLGRQRQVWFIPIADERGVCR